MWSTIEQAYTGGNVHAFLDNIAGVPLNGRNVEVPDHFPAALREQVRILRILEDIIGGAGLGMARRKEKYAKVHARKSGWVQAHEALMREVAALMDRYKESTRAAGQMIDVQLMDEVRRQLEDTLGKLSCEYLEAFYQGWDMKPDEKKRLVAGWRLIGKYIEQLTANM